MVSGTSRTLVVGSSLFVAAMVVVTVTFVLVRQPGHQRRFKDHIDEYLAINKEQTDQSVYVKGKMVVISKQEKEVDDEVYPALPNELRADSPAEVGTVVILKWGAQVRGVYTGGNASALWHTCEVTVIDRSLSAIVGRQDFRGGDPPVSTTGRGDIYGTKPIQEIVAYLTALPRETGGEAAPIRDWMVLFRSDDPSVWNTDSPGDKFAVPLRRVPLSIRFLRLKRMDTGAMLILPISHKQLLREDKPEPAEGCWWNGTAADGWGGRHLGLVQAPPLPLAEKGTILVSNHNFFTGSGFGHKMGVDDRQYCCWQGKEVPRITFEIAVTPNPLTEAEKRILMGYDPDEGAPPSGWTVLFRSDDPAVWNTDSPGRSFAVPVWRAHSKVRHLRLKRMDTGESLIVPIAREQLARQPRSPGEKEVLWSGTAGKESGGYHLGIIQGPAIQWPEAIAVSNQGGAFTGSGFGHKIGFDDRQYYCWQGKEIPKTSFEVAITADPLTAEEKGSLSTAVALKKPLPRVAPGTPVPNALAQPEPPKTDGKTTVDLIGLIDQSKDVVLGRWLVVKNALHCNDFSNVPRIQIPYQPPEEYDFVVTFSQPVLRNGISLIMPNPRGGSFFWAVGYNGGRKFGFQAKNLKDDGLVMPLMPGKAYTTVVQVRRDGVKALVDGKVVMEHKTDFRDLSCDSYREIPDTKLLAVACDDPTVFHYVRLVEITGTGKKAR